jgi:hypothetical protein
MDLNTCDTYHTFYEIKMLKLMHLIVEVTRTSDSVASVSAIRWFLTTEVAVQKRK